MQINKENLTKITWLLLFALIASIVVGVSVYKDQENEIFELYRQRIELKEEIKDGEKKLNKSKDSANVMLNMASYIETLLLEMDELIVDYDTLVLEECYTYNSKAFNYAYDDVADRYMEIKSDYNKLLDALNTQEL